MRKVKCKKCGIQTQQNAAHKVIHVTKTGNKQNKYYCTEKCYNNEQHEIYMLKQCQYLVDEILGYECINNAKNANIKQIIDSGYTREQLFDCMMELKETIIKALDYRQDIESEYQKIQYMFAIVKGKIREITLLNNELKLKENIKAKTEHYIDEYIPELKARKISKKRTGLMDILGG